MSAMAQQPSVHAQSLPKLARNYRALSSSISSVAATIRINPGYRSSVSCKSSLWCNVSLSSTIGAQGFLSSSGTQYNHLVPLSSQFFGESDCCRVNWFLFERRKSFIPLRASKYNDVFKFKYPVITEKPEWWWRTLAAIPYLLALQISETGYFLMPLLEHYQILKFLIFLVPGAIKRLPTWFPIIYCYFGYVGLVKNKDWPHFFRFHLMMAMLLETALQLIWHTSTFFPLIHYNGRFGMHFWFGIGIFFIFTLLKCVRSALSGKYAHIPFVSDAAYIHTLFNTGSLPRFF